MSDPTDDRDATGPGPEMPAELWAVPNRDGTWMGNNNLWISCAPAEHTARECARTYGGEGTAPVLIGVSPARLEALEARVRGLEAERDALASALREIAAGTIEEWVRDCAYDALGRLDGGSGVNDGE